MLAQLKTVIQFQFILSNELKILVKEAIKLAFL